MTVQQVKNRKLVMRIMGCVGVPLFAFCAVGNFCAGGPLSIITATIPAMFAVESLCMAIWPEA